MKKITSIILLLSYVFAFTGCARVYLKEQDPMELWGADARVFEGRVYSATSTDRDRAIKKIAEVAKKKGYNYFTLMADKNTVSAVKTQSFGNTFANAFANGNAYGNNNYVNAYGNAYGNATNNSVSTTSNVYMFYVLAFFLKDNELNEWKNVYSVSKYTK